MWVSRDTVAADYSCGLLGLEDQTNTLKVQQVTVYRRRWYLGRNAVQLDTNYSAGSVSTYLPHFLRVYLPRCYLETEADVDGRQETEKKMT